MLRNLRIAFSIVCGILCLLLIALWVRSATTSDTLHGRISVDREFDIHSSEGAIILIVEAADDGEWGILSIAHPSEMEGYSDSRWRAGTTTLPGWYVIGPHWFLVAAFALLGIALWRPPRRFSLRTLLIATTLVAVVLGIVVLASR
jgi:hypothetical protein